MLHSKLLILDGRLLVIGSMNLDLRSQLQNTEIALLIRSPAACRHAPQSKSKPPGRCRLACGAGQRGRLVAGAQRTSRAEGRHRRADTSALRWLVRILGWFAPDHLL